MSRFSCPVPVCALTRNINMSSSPCLQIVSSEQNLVPTSEGNPKFKEACWKFISSIMGGFFLLCGLVQYNDPDVFLWMPVYIIPCLISWTIAFGMHFLRITETSGVSSRRCIGFFESFFRHMDQIIVCHMTYCIGLGILTLWNLFIIDKNKIVAPLSSGTMKDEEVKELFGLCIVLAWLSLLKNYKFLKFGKIGIFLGSLLTFLPILSWLSLDVIEGLRGPCS